MDGTDPTLQDGSPPAAPAALPQAKEARPVPVGAGDDAVVGIRPRPSPELAASEAGKSGSLERWGYVNAVSAT
jgi:hypothetical protein